MGILSEKELKKSLRGDIFVIELSDGGKVIVPVGRESNYQKNIREFRPSMMNMGRVEERSRTKWIWTDAGNNYGYYRNEDAEILCEFGLWERMEMFWGFMSYGRFVDCDLNKDLIAGSDRSRFEKDTTITDNDFRRGVKVNSFVFAKSMPKNPHYYAIRKGWRGAVKFEEMAKKIRREGDLEYFWKTPYLTLTIDGYKYWTMGAPLAITMIINRKEA